MPRAAQQIIGREGETAIFLSRCLFTICLRVFGFAPRQFNRCAASYCYEHTNLLCWSAGQRAVHSIYLGDLPLCCDCRLSSLPLSMVAYIFSCAGFAYFIAHLAYGITRPLYWRSDVARISKLCYSVLCCDADCGIISKHRCLYGMEEEKSTWLGDSFIIVLKLMNQ